MVLATQILHYRGRSLWFQRCDFRTAEKPFLLTTAAQNMHDLRHRSCGCDYLDFLPKRPQGTTKILGTPAFAGTKTPAVLKFSSKGATTDCVETPVNCPHCGQKWRLRRRLRRQPFILLSFSSSKKARKAQETQSYQRFQCIGHTDFNTSGTNGPRSLSRVKAGTHSAFGERSHTAAHTPKHGPSGRGRYHYPQHVLHVHKHPRAGYQNGVLCRFWGLVRCTPEGRRKPAGQRCAYARRCPEASRPRWAALLCLQFGEFAVLFTLRAGLSTHAKEGVVSLPSVRFACCRNAGRPLAKTAHLPFSEVR